MARQLVYILGLSRVGSTLLDLTLGSHPPFVGLGEVFQVIRPDFDRFNAKEYCSCGKIILVSASTAVTGYLISIPKYLDPSGKRL